MVPAARCSKCSGPFMQFMDEGTRRPTSPGLPPTEPLWPPLRSLGRALGAQFPRCGRCRQSQGSQPPLSPGTKPPPSPWEGSSERIRQPRVRGQTETWGCEQESTSRSVFGEQASTLQSETRVGKDPLLSSLPPPNAPPIRKANADHSLPAPRAQP